MALRKDRLEKVNLFMDFTPVIKYKRLTNKLESNRMDKIFLKKLEELNKEVRENREVKGMSDDIKKILNHFADSRNLKKWAASKNIEIE